MIRKLTIECSAKRDHGMGRIFLLGKYVKLELIALLKVTVALFQQPFFAFISAWVKILQMFFGIISRFYQL